MSIKSILIWGLILTAAWILQAGTLSEHISSLSEWSGIFINSINENAVNQLNDLK